MPSITKPVGAITRGTTGYNRLRRSDRWLVHSRRVRTALQAAGIDYESADVEFVPSLKVEVDADTARKVFRLIDALEDSDDVQNVWSNFDISDKELEAAAAAG